MADVDPDPRDGSRAARLAGTTGRTATIAGAKLLSNVTLAAAGLLSARSLGTSGRGEVVLALTVAGVVSLVATAGTPLAARLHLVDEGSSVRLSDHVGLATALTTLAGAATVAVVIAALPAAGVDVTARLVVATAVYAAAQAASALALELLNTYGANRTAAVCDLAGSAIQLVAFALVAVVATDPRAHQFVFAAAGALASQLAITIAALAARRWLARPTWSMAANRTLLRTGVASLGSTIGQVATFRLDRYLLGCFVDPAAVGIYSVAATVTELVRLVPSAAGQVLFHPLATGRRGVADVRRERVAVFLAVAAGSVLAVLLGPTVIRIAFGSAFSDAADVLWILAIAELGVAIFFFDARVLSATRRVAMASAAALVGLVVTLVADIALIPTWDLEGAAWASVIAYGSMAIVTSVAVRRTTTAAA